MSAPVEVTPAVLQATYDKISDIDGKLGDAQSAGKIALRNQMRRTFVEVKDDENVSLTENGESIQTFSNWLAKFEGDELVGAVAAVNELLKPFEKTADAHLTTKVPASDGDKLTDDQISELSAQRKELFDEYKLLRGILQMWKQDVSTIPVPEAKNAPRGPQAPKVFKSYQFFVDGNERTGTSNTISSIAASVMKASTSDLVDLIKENVEGWSEETPPASFEITIPAPTETQPNQTKVLKGVLTSKTEMPSE